MERTTSTSTRRVRFACAAASAVVALGATGGVARADDAPGAEQRDTPYSLEIVALTGPRGADVTLELDAGAGGPEVETFKKVQLKTFAADGSVQEVRNLKDVALRGASFDVNIGPLERGRRVEAHVLVQADAATRTYPLRAATTARLRPDLAVASVAAPPQTLTTDPVDVHAEIRELNGDTGATATVTLRGLLGPVADPVSVTVAPGGTASVTFSGVALTTPVPVELTADVSAASPHETDASNNERTAIVDVTEHELDGSDERVVVPSFGGYGAQFNQHVYAPITVLPPGATFDDLETAVTALEPQLVRIFYNEDFEEPRNPRYNPGNVVSFRRTVGLAQAAGATVNITYQVFADARLAPGPHMQRFVAELEHLVKGLGYTNVRWVTVGNEPNSPGLAITLQQWEALHRALHRELVARGLRDHIKIMGGDLVESSGLRDHAVWFKYMTTNMADIVDSYSEHVYWWYDTFNLEGAWRFQFRLRDIRKLVVDDNPPETRRPAFIMEFAVRGLNAVAGQPTVANFAYYEDGTELRRTNLAAFQQLWFNIASAQLGFAGTSKWDLYWGKYDFTTPPNQSYWTLDATSEGWKPFPSYHALRLLLATTERGWQGVRIQPWKRDDWDPLLRDEPEKELAAYVGDGSKLTVLGLDTRGRLLNTKSDQAPAYSIGGLPPSTTLNLAIWNAVGDGATAAATQITTSAAGVARFEVPLHAAFALTTVAVS